MYSSYYNSQKSESKCTKCNKEEEKKLTVHIISSLIIFILHHFTHFCDGCIKSIQQHYSNLHLQQKIELKRGRMMNHNSDKSNTISTTIYNKNSPLKIYQLFFENTKKLSFLPKTIYEFFTKIGNIFFLAIALIMLIRPSLSPFKQWIIISPLLFYILVFMLKELYYDYIRYKNDQYWNQRKCQKQKNKEKKQYNIQLQKNETMRLETKKTFTNNNNNGNGNGNGNGTNLANQKSMTASQKTPQDFTHIEEIKWEEVRVGDILRVQHGEIAPADMILLDSNVIRDKLPVCYINTLQVDGKENQREIKASTLTRISHVKDTKKSYFNKYKTRLNLKLIYETPSSDNSQFYGQLRLKKDPKVEEITINNFIPRGCKIEMNKEKDWVFGLVVYTGMDTKVMIDKQYNVTKQTHVEKLINAYFLLNICIVAIFAIISMIVIVAKSKDIEFLLKAEPTISDSIRLFTYIILYSQVIPLAIYVVVDLVQIGSAMMIEKRMRQKNNERNHYFKINNPNNLSNLGQIDYIFMDKIGVPSQGNKSICQMLLFLDDYIFNPNELKQELVDKQWNKPRDTKFTSYSPMQTKTLINNELGKETESKQNEFKTNMSLIEKKENEEKPDETVPSEPALIMLKKDFKYGKTINNQIIFSPSNFDTQEIVLEDKEAQNETAHQNNQQKVDNNPQDNKIINNFSQAIEKDLKEQPQQNEEKPKEPERKATIPPSIAQSMLNKGNSNQSNAFSGSERSSMLEQKINRNYTTQKFVQKITDLSNITDDYIANDPITQLMMSMLICNNIQLSLLNLERSTVTESSNPLDDQIIQFALKSGFTIKRDDNYFYLQAFGKQIMKVSEKMTNYPRAEKQTFSTVVKIEGDLSLHQKETRHYIYCRGEPNVIRNKLSMDIQNANYFDSLLNTFKKRGVQPIIFARRQLNEVEYKQYSSSYKGFKNDPQIQEEELKQLGISIENSLEYIGTIGLIDQINPQSYELFQFIQQANMNTYFLSNESSDSTFNTAILSDGYGKNANKQYFCISEEGVDEIWSQTRSILNELKEIFSKKENSTKVFSNPNKQGATQTNIQAQNGHVLHTDGDQKKNGGTIQMLDEDKEKDGIIKRISNADNPNQQSPDQQKVPSDDKIKNQQSMNQLPQNEKQVDLEQLKVLKGIALKKYESDKRQQKYQLQLNGKSLAKILRDTSLQQHFAFILQFCKVVIGYNMNPQIKGELVKIVKQCMLFNPTVCAVGDGFKDTEMMKQADISIEIVHQADTPGYLPTDPKRVLDNIIYSNAGDIQVSNIEGIRDLILVEGTNVFFKLQNLIFFMFYKCLLFGLPLFYFNWYSAFTGTSLFESLWVFLYNFLFNFVTVFLYGIFEQPFSSVVLRTFPSLYVAGQVEKDRVFSNYLVKCAIEGIIQGTIIYYVSIYIVSRSISSEGQVSDFGMISLVNIYSIILVFNFRVIFTANSLAIWVGQAFAVIFIACFIFANGSETFSNYNWVIISDQIFRRGDSFCAIIFNCISCIVISHFVNLFLVEQYFPNVYQGMAIKIEDEQSKFFTNNLYCNLNQFLKIKADWKTLSNEAILECSINRKIDFANLIKKIFTKSSDIQQSVLDMISASDSDVSEMQMHRWTLQFQDHKHEVKYKYERTQSSSQTFRLVYILNMIPMAAYILADSLTNSQLDQIVGFIRAGMVIFFFVCTLLVLHQSFQNGYYNISFGLLFLGVICKIILDWIQTEFSIAMTTIIATCLLTFNFNLGTVQTLVLNTLNSVNFIIRIVVVYYAEGYNKVVIENNSQSENTTLRKFFAITSFVIMVVYVFLLSVYVIFKSEREKRKYFISQQTIKIQKTENDNLLSILVPKFVQNKLNSGKFEMADDQDEVAILFADVCDVDEIMEVEKDNIVSLLDDLFRGFDSICERHGAQKIETVGKTYMAATGIIECEIDIDNNLKQKGKGQRLVNMAKDMIDYSSNKKWGNNKTFNMKIGINKGKVMAGVIGNPKPQFSLIGDTVNTTSRICAESKPNEILVSESIKEEVKSMKFKLVQHKFTPKGKSELSAYFIKDLQTSNLFHKARERISNNKANNSLQQRHSLTNTNTSQTVAQRQSNMVNYLFKQQTPTSPKNIKSQKSGGRAINGETSSAVQIQKAGDSPTKPKSNSQKFINVDINAINQDDQQTYQNQNDTLYDDEYDSDSDFDENEFSGEGDLKFNPLLNIKSSVSNETIYKFQDNMKRDNLRGNKIMILLLILLYFLSTLILITVRQIIDHPSAIFVLRAIFCGSLIVVFIILPLSFNKLLYKYIIFIIFLYGIVPTFVQGTFIDFEDLVIIQIIEMLCIYTTFSYIVVFNFTEVIIYSFVQSCVFIGLIWPYLDLSNCFFFFVYQAFVIQKSYSYLRHSFKNFNFLSKISSKKNRMKELVDQLLPAVALNKMRNQGNFNDKKELTDEFEDVTVLFADIKGFTEFSDKVVDPKKVLLMLKNLFESFDGLCVKHQVFKLYTIGDCYVVLSFVTAERQNTEAEKIEEAKRVINLGLDMIETINTIKGTAYPFLNMRIGIHTGKIIGGIMGTDVVRYDVYGRDVMIANKMESNGEPGKVMISQSTRNILEKEENFSYNISEGNTVTVKGKVPEVIQGYFITKRNDQI